MANELTDFLAQEESSGGTNPKARKLDVKGTGKYQLGAELYKDIQAQFPEFADIPYERAALEPGLDLKAAQAGAQVVNKQIAGLGIAPTRALIATVWQQGIGNFKKAYNKARKSNNNITQALDPLGRRRLTRAMDELPSPQGE